MYLHIYKGLRVEFGARRWGGETIASGSMKNKNEMKENEKTHVPTPQRSVSL